MDVPQEIPSQAGEGAGLTLRRALRKIGMTREFGPLALLIILSTLIYLRAPAFLSTMNVSNMLQYVPELGLMALGMTLLLTAGEMDLSVGAMFAFCPVLVYVFFNEGFLPFEASVVVVMLICALIGLANGLLVTKVGMSSFVTTIGMMLIVRGTALYVTNGFPQSTWETESIIKNLLVGSVAKVGEFELLASLFWYIGLALILHLLLHNTRFGNWITATGGNLKAARARAVNTDTVKIVLFTLSAVLSGLAGMMDSLRIEAAYPVSGTGYELEVIAMTVIGGTLLSGGRGTILGTFIGVLLLRSIRNGMIVVGVPGLAYNIFIGAIILVMMSVHSAIEKRQVGEC